MDNQNLQNAGGNSEKSLSKVFICHRIPERTFKINNAYFPVCSRCTGIYVGAISYYVFVYFVYIQYNIVMILLGLLMILPMFSDGLTQFFSLRESNNALRFATGLIAGIGLGILVKVVKWILIS